MTIGNNSEVQLMDGRDGLKFVSPTTSGYQPCVDYFKEHRGQKLSLMLRASPGSDAIADLLACTDVDLVERLHVQAKGLVDIQRLSNLTNLKSFTVDVEIRFDFSRLSRLEFVGGVWSAGWVGLEHCKLLRDLHISSLKRENLMSFPGLKALEKLIIITTSLKSLQGVEEAQGLSVLSISNARHLSDIQSVTKLEALRSLEFDSCKKIERIEMLGEVRGLQYLKIFRCGSIPSLSFISRNSSLLGLGIVETKVEDLNLQYCIDHPTLKHFGSLAMKGANPSVREVEGVLARRRGGA